MSEDTTGSGLGGVSGGGLEGGATGTGGAGGTTGVGAGGGATASGSLAAGLGGLAGRLPNGGASLLNRLAEGSPLPVHDHLTPSTGGTIDYLRTQWGTDHLGAADPHPQYLTPAEGDTLFLTPAEGDARYAPIGGGGGTADVTITTDASLTSTESPANTFALATRRSATAGNSLALNADGLFVPDFLTQAEGDARYPLAGATDPYPQYATDADLAAHAAAGDPHPVYLSQTEGDARYPLKTDPDPYPQYLTAAELPPATDVTVTTDASLSSTESPANTFALAVRLSPDAGNALALRGNGLFATDTTGGGAGGGLATDPLADAKGDVFAASGPDAVGRLPAGANGLVLTADSAQALGVGWAAPATQSHGHGGSAGDGGVIPYLPLTGGTLTGALTLQGAAAATNVLQAKLAADTQPRFRSDASGRLEWGPGGATAPAAALYRNSGGALETTAALVPDATNTRSLGTSATAWSSVWGLLLQTPNTGSLVLGVSLPASAGAIRLRNAANGLVAWRNAGNTADLTLTVDASDRFAFTSDVLVTEATPTVALQQAADTQPRSRLSDTALAFGPGGTTAPDTTLQRTGAGALRVDTHLGVGVNPLTAWAATHRTVQLGQAGAVSGSASGTASTTIGDNSYWDGTNSRAVIAGAMSQINLQSGGLLVYTAPSVAAGATQTLTQRAQIGQTGTLTLTPDANAWAQRITAPTTAGQSYGLIMTAGTNAGDVPFQISKADNSRTMLNLNGVGTLTLTPDAGQAALATPGFQVGLSGGHPELYSSTGIIWTRGSVALAPTTDNSMGLGGSANRWTTVYAVAGTINTSAREAKQDITPLDPAACAQAVLDTDWVNFEYTPPPLPPAGPGETVAQSTNRVSAHSRMVQETAVARRQKGYVLGSPQHRISPLFGLEDRKSASPQADLAVVACALQDVLRRIAILEGATAA
jgi:hypothetical protein